MKKIKRLFAFLMVLIFIIYITTIDHLYSFKLLLTGLILMLILSFLLYKESLQKINSLFKADIELTREFVFCIASLPVLYVLWNSRYLELVSLKIIVYLIILLLSIFNYGIRSKTNG